MIKNEMIMDALRADRDGWQQLALERRREIERLLKEQVMRREPTRCLDCGLVEVRNAVLPEYKIKCNRDGVLHDVTVKDLPILKCGACGCELFTNTTDDQITIAEQQATIERLRAELDKAAEQNYCTLCGRLLNDAAKVVGGKL